MATQFSVNDNIPWKTRFFTIQGGQAISIIGSQLVQFALMAICGLFIPAVMQIESRDTTMPGDVSQSLA